MISRDITMLISFCDDRLQKMPPTLAPLFIQHAADFSSNVRVYGACKVLRAIHAAPPPAKGINARYAHISTRLLYTGRQHDGMLRLLLLSRNRYHDILMHDTLGLHYKVRTILLFINYWRFAP